MDSWESNNAITFDVEWPWKVKVKVTEISKLISCKGAKLGHILLININRKAYTGNPLVRLHLALSELERSVSRSLRFWRHMSHKEAELGLMLLLDTNESNDTII